MVTRSTTSRGSSHRGRPKPPRKKRPFDHFEYLIALGATIDESELRKMPRDGAKNFDHYLDGSPKQK